MQQNARCAVVAGSWQVVSVRYNEKHLEIARCNWTERIAMQCCVLRESLDPAQVSIVNRQNHESCFFCILTKQQSACRWSTEIAQPNQKHEIMGLVSSRK